MSEGTITQLNIADAVCKQATRMLTERGVKPEYVLLGYHTALVLSIELKMPEALDRHRVDPPTQLSTPAGRLTVIVDPYRPEGIKVYPAAENAMRVVGYKP
jgi:hypothetical protein